MIRNLITEWRFTLRSLLRDRRFCLGVILTLAVGIGGATTVYSVLHSMLFPAFSYDVDGRLALSESYRIDERGQPISQPMFPTYADWKKASGPLWADVATEFPIGYMQTGDNRTMFREGTFTQPRFYMGCVVFFALLAVALAVNGVYALTRYNAERRTREISIRIAVGATTRDILSMMLRQGVLLSVAGIVAGVTLFLNVNQALASFIYKVTPSDPLMLLAIVALIFVVALAANLLPAWRATKTDPALTLKSE